jgi:ankyrin repeat protein
MIARQQMSDIIAQCRGYILCGHAGALERAILAEHDEFEKFVNDFTDANGKTLLTLAIFGKRIECVKVLLRHGADPDTADGSKTVPLDYAMGNIKAIAALIEADMLLDSDAVSAILMENDEELTDAVFGRIGDVNAPIVTMDGNISPILFAAKCGFIRSVEILVNRGADVRAVDADGCTALDVAREWEGSQYVYIEEFLQNHMN